MVDQISNENCHDCYVKPGEFHIEGCDIERCGKCGGRYISCGCPDQEQPIKYGDEERFPTIKSFDLALRQSIHDLLTYVIETTDALYICNELPTSFEEATKTYALGVQESPVLRKNEDELFLIVEASTKGSIFQTDQANCFALVSSPERRELLIAYDLFWPSQVVSGSEFDLDQFRIGDIHNGVFS